MLNNTIGNHNRRVHPKTMRNRLRAVRIRRSRRAYIGLPLIRPLRARRTDLLAAHAQRRFPMRQRRRVIFLR